ncbi:MAG: hypothetical protein IPN75_05215 [Dechloromonas sp.]|uniref:Uncharacterized protein n=1 Tax=Candidatus Dechloromonas phosphorivorans TaxID=2899244 RepID=A0A9D7LPQ0_9RHOO|nr:hypothetical protein [Candidatus Dechloromonas phosphorivorans]
MPQLDLNKGVGPDNTPLTQRQHSPVVFDLAGLSGVGNRTSASRSLLPVSMASPKDENYTNQALWTALAAVDHIPVNDNGIHAIALGVSHF